MTTKKYIVRILDNFNFMDKKAEYNSGVFDTYEEAVIKCKEILDDFLESSYRPGDTAESLYSTYLQYGETPLIWGDSKGTFNSNEYTRLKCLEIWKRYQPRTDERKGKITSKKQHPFLLKPLENETIDQFKKRAKKILDDRLVDL